MSSFMDNLYDKIQQNSAKRHRTVSLLMVMSIFVTSGVVWVLRGTGITMVNDPICDVEEHEHSADCIRKTLICMVEDETHIHEDACYLTEVICPKPEHIHIPACYTDQLLDGYIVQEDPEPENYIELESAEVSDAEEPSSEDVESEESGLPDPEQADSNDKDENESDTDENSDDKNDIEQTVDDDETASDDSEASEEDAEGPLLEHGTNYLQSAEQAGLDIVTTADNRADGIIIHLFDYGTEGLDHGRSDYRNPAYVGINEGRNLQDDILFFSYGTPSGEAENYEPTKNNYSGDYNADHLVSGNRPVQGIVNNTLTNGFPTIAGSNHSLDYLFDMNEVIGSDSNDPIKIVYEDINHFLQKDATGKYFFDSSDNYAYYNPNQGDRGDFTLYSGTFDIQNDDHHTQGGRPYNPAIRNEDLLENERYKTELSPMKIGFFPFDAFDDSKVDPNFNATRIENEDGSSSDQAIYNHHFGMTMSANFVVPKDANGNTNGQFNNQDIVFNYSGDDDMWVFVDDKLILDIGGIHEPTAGSINFTQNIVRVQDNAYGTIDGGDGNKYIETTVSAMLGISDAEYWSWFTGQPHTIKMFYMERGGCYSNLAMDFNLPTVKTIDVTKNLDQGSGTGYENEMFRYELWTKAYDAAEYTKYDGVYYVNNTQFRTDNGIFFLKHGQTASFFDGLDTIESYYVKEVAVDNQLISDVTVNGNSYQITDQSEISSPQYNFTDTSGVIWFQNKIRETYTDLAVQKKWVGGDQSAIDKIQFRLFQSKNGGEKIPVIVEGQRTFAIKQENGQWVSKSFTHLPSEYGRDQYTYTVDEVYVPNGYSSSTASPVMINGVATIVITNTSRENSQLHVKKEWYDNQGNLMTTPPQTSVKFKIKRSYLPYEEPKETRFIVQTINETTGMQTGSWTADGVYVGGSVEFSLNILNGIDVRSVTIDGRPVSSTYGIYEAKDIQENSVVTVYYTDKYDDTSKSAEASYILYHSFSGTTDGWRSFGGKDYNGTYVTPTVATNGHASYAKNDGLAIELNYNDRFWIKSETKVDQNTGRNSGAYFPIDTDVLRPGLPYSFSLYVQSADGNQNIALTLKYTDTNGEDQYRQIGQVSASNGSWSHLENQNFTMPDDIDPSKDVWVYVETVGDNNTEIHDIFIDEFVVAPGGTQINVQPVNVSPGSGKTWHLGYLNLTKNSGTMTVVHSSDFETSLNSWTPYGSNEVQIDRVNDAFVGNGAVRVSNRSQSFHGIQLPDTYNVFEKGKTYSLSAYVKTENNSSSTPFKFTLKYKNTNGEDVYHQVGIAYADGADKWTRLSASNFRIPDNVDMTKDVVLYIESPDNTANFYVDQVVIATGENLEISTDLYSAETKIAQVSSLNFPRNRFDGSLDGWRRRGNAQAENNSGTVYAGSSSVSVTNRQQTWQGIELPLTDFEKYKPGTTHNFSIYVNPNETTTMKMTLTYTPKGSGSAVYPTVVEMSNVPAGQWTQLANTAYKIPDDVDTEKDVLLYIEAPSSNTSFLVDEFVEGPVGRKVTVNPGDGSLQMDTLTVNLNADTAIPPSPKTSDTMLTEYIHNGNLTPIEFELGSTGDWKMGFRMSSKSGLTSGEANYGVFNGNPTLYEDPNCNYYYEIEEVSVPDGYVVSYDKQGSSSTTDDAPMLIKNKYSAYELPPTGGTGTAGYYMIGVFLLVLSVLYGCYGNKRERRQQ